MTKKKNVPETSKEAYQQLDLSQLRETYRNILLALAELGSGTFEDIAAKMKVDKSTVWKRLSELQRMELIYRPGTKKMLKSGRNGYMWALTSQSIPKTEKSMKELKGQPAVVDYSRKLISDKQGAKQLDLL